jgi:hypothetical protein
MFKSWFRAVDPEFLIKAYQKVNGKFSLVSFGHVDSPTMAAKSVATRYTSTYKSLKANPRNGL